MDHRRSVSELEVQLVTDADGSRHIDYRDATGTLVTSFVHDDVLAIAASDNGESGTDPAPSNAVSPITGWYHATAYGAMFDGTTDDTDAIMAAITDCQNAGGGRIYLNPGTTRVRNGASASAGCLNISGNDVELAGAGKGITVIKLLDAQDTSFDVTGIVRTQSGTEQTDVTFRDFTIDGNKANNATVGKRVIGFYCGVTPNATTTDKQIKCVNIEIRNCSAYGFDPHERVTGLVLDHCEAHDNDQDGFTLDGQFDAVLTGCLAWNNGRHGFNWVTASCDGTMVNCHAWGNVSNGCTIQNACKRIKVVGGSFHDNAADGILINGIAQAAPAIDTAQGYGCSVNGASVYKNGTHGIELNGAKFTTISGNTVVDNSSASAGTSYGVYFNETGTTYSTDNIVTGNVIASSGAATHKYGVQEKTANDDRNLVVGNRVTGTTSTAIHLAGTASTAAAANNITT